MKKLLILLLLLLFPFTFSLFTVHAQTISTAVGNHSLGPGYSGDGGPATAAQLDDPYGVACDASGNLYIADIVNNVIRKVNISGTITTVAGNHAYGAGFSGDGGIAIAAELNSPNGVALDVSGNLYIADNNNNLIRKVNTSGIISTVAGNHAYGAGFSGDGGPATAAELFAPTSIALSPSGNLYIADAGNNIIRMVNTSGTISTVVGNYSFLAGYSGDGGPATAAEINVPQNVTIDASGNLCFADANNNVIRRVNTSGIISTVAGNNIRGFSGDGGAATAAEFYDPTAVAYSASGNLYIADFDNNVIRVVNTSGIISAIAGNNVAGYSGDGGPATTAELKQPFAVSVDASGNLYIGDLDNDVIRKVTLNPCTLVEAPPTINQNVTCYGGSDASATAVISSGGTSPYTYQWNSGTTSTNATNSALIAGVYTITITDNTGCSATTLAIITQPPALADTMLSSCAGCCNCHGVAIDSIYGGTMPYTFSWSNGGTSGTLTGIAGGSYTCMVTDANGCTKTDTVFVTFGPHVTNSTSSISCNGANDGTAGVTIAGNYTYIWSPGGATTSSISGLSAGNYTVTYTNSDTTICVNSEVITVIEPPPLTINPAIFGGIGYTTANYCADSGCYSIGLTAMGGTPPYTYTGESFNPFTCFGETISGTVEDAHGCMASINFPLYIGLSIRVIINNNVTCNGGNDGSATVNINTGPYLATYSWSPGGGTNQTQTNLSAGTYTVTVMSNIPDPVCSVQEVFVITQPPALTLIADSTDATTGNCDGSASAIVSGGNSPYTYSWATAGQTTSTISGQCAGDYCCNVTDANGCQNSVCVNIDVSTGTNEVKGESGEVIVYPNPNNGVFTVTFSHAELVSASQPIVKIYNVLGQEIYFATLKQVQGDNFIDISSQPDGIYLIRIENEDGGLIAQKKIVKM